MFQPGLNHDLLGQSLAIARPGWRMGEAVVYRNHVTAEDLAQTRVAESPRPMLELANAVHLSLPPFLGGGRRVPSKIRCSSPRVSGEGSMDIVLDVRIALLALRARLLALSARPAPRGALSGVGGRVA